MKEISISLLLKCISQERNYEEDIWKQCLDEKGKRYKRNQIRNCLKKLIGLGFIKKVTISSMDKFYIKNDYSDPDEYMGKVYDVLFNYESKIKQSLQNLQNKKIFVDITKDLNSFQIKEQSKNNFETLSTSIFSMKELSSSILLIKNNTKNEDFKNKLKKCSKEINQKIDETNEIIIRDRKTNEIILLQRHLVNKIPSEGYLKI